MHDNPHAFSVKIKISFGTIGLIYIMKDNYLCKYSIHGAFLSLVVRLARCALRFSPLAL